MNLKTGVGILLIVVICSLFGCAPLEIKRTVQGNLFISESEPRLKVKVDPSLSYFGKYEREKSYHSVAGSPRAINTVFVFGDVGDANLVKRALIISFWTLKVSDNYWLSDVFSSAKYVLDRRSVIVDGTPFSNILAVSSPFFGREEQAYIQSKGYVVLNAYMWKGLGGIVDRAQRTKMYIFYIEDMKLIDETRKYSFDKWQSEAMLVSEQRSLLHQFANRSKKAFSIVGLTEETAFKPVGEAPFIKEGKNDVAEKLQRVKELRDKGLISQDEYEKKKAELLNRI